MSKEKRKVNKTCYSKTFTIKEFCGRHKISRSHYYDLRKSGDGPKEIRSGRLVRITREAEGAWLRRMGGKK